MKTNRIYIFFLISVFIITLSKISHAATYYVSPTGSATWANCSALTPLNGTSACSWQTVMVNAVAGDIVYFRGGTYNVGVIGSQRDYANMRPSNSGTSANPITFIAYPGEVSNITGTVNSSSTAAYFGCSYNNYITWDGFAATLQVYSGAYETQTWAAWGSNYCTLKNSNFTGTDVGSRPYNTSFVRIEASNYIVIENNYFHDLTGTTNAVNTAGVWMFGRDNNTIRKNTFSHTRGGVYGKTRVSSANIYNNFIYNPVGDECQDGIYIGYQGGSATAGFNIYQNVIVGCNRGIRLVGIVGMINNSKIYNNSIHNGVGSQAGVYIADGVINVEIFNNIIYGSLPLVRYYTTSTYSYSNNNIFYHASSTVWSLNHTTNYTSLTLWRRSTSFDANSITANPLFVSAGGASPEDYRLQPNSPVKGKGRDGKDMGAYPNKYGDIIGYKLPEYPMLRE